MTITFANGEQLTTASEIDLFDITLDRFFSCYIFTDEMLSGDTIVIRVYTLDSQDSVMRIHTTDTLSGAQTSDGFYAPSLPTKQYKVSIQRTAGPDNTYSWQRVEAN